MKIAVVIPSISRVGGGVSESARLLVDALSDIPGYSVEIATLLDSHFEEDRPAWGKTPVFAFPYYGPANYGFSPSLATHLQKREVDLVHIHGVWMFHCLAALLWSQRTNRPYIITPHGMLDPWITARSPGLKKAVSHLYQDKFIRSADVIHTLTEREGRDIISSYGPLPIKTVPNYVPTVEKIRDTAPPSWFRKDFEGKDIYLFLGRIHEKKGCGELLDAWNRLSTEDEEFRNRSVLVFCGWLDGMKEFPEKVKMIERKWGNVLYAGPQYGLEKTRSFSAATFFVLPSKSEGLPVAILEAWGASKLVLMTSECNLSIGFEKGAALRIGLSPDEITQGLKEASLMSVEARQKMRAAGCALVTERFSRSVVATAFERIYQDAITAKNKKHYALPR